jgi:hypothetical protein
MSGTTDPLIAAQNLTNSFMNSPAHRANILNPNYTHVGIGSWTTAPGQTWSGGGAALSRVWIATQVFAQMPVTAAPAAALSPAGVAFGDRTVGVSGAAQNVTVSNTGNAAMAVSGASLSGANAGDFSIASNTCGNVPAGGSCTIGVAFKPVASGARSASLSVTDNAAGSPHAVSLSGKGVDASPAVAPTNVQVFPGDALLTVSWIRPADPAGAIDGYGVFLFDPSGNYTGRWAWVCATCTAGTVTGLTNGNSYFAIVYPHTASGWGAGGYAAASVIVGTPAPPANVVATRGNGQVTVTWSAASTASGIDGYGLLAFDSTGYTNLSAWLCGTCTSGTVTGLTNGKPYTIMVYAHNTYGWSSPTATSQFVPGP